MKYDIFISYRREGGDTLAQLIYDRLTYRGYKVFLDIESLNAGKFNEKLLDVIEECKDIIVVLPPNALDRCRNEGDWVYRELQYAISHSKNIIPVMMKDFVWPDDIPEDIADIRNYNGILDNKDYFDAVIDKLTTLMKSKPVFGGRLFQRNVPKKSSFKDKIKKRKKIIVAVIALICVCGGIAGFLKYNEEQKQIKEESYVTIELSPNEEMSASEYYDVIEIVEKRFEILADGQDCIIEEDKENVSVSIPLEVFHDIDVEDILQCYVTRPTEVYLASDNMDTEDVFHIERSAIKNVELVSDVPVEVDFSNYELKGIESEEDCRYFALTIEEDTVKKAKDWIAEKERNDYRLFQDMDDFGYSWCYSLAGIFEDGNVLYFVDNYQYDNILELIQYNYSNETPSGYLFYSVKKPVHWEKSGEGVTFGNHQCEEKELSGELARFDYSSYGVEDMSEGEYLDIIRILKGRLDALGTPYAFGYHVDDPYVFSVKINPEYMNNMVYTTLGKCDCLVVKSNLYNILDGFDKSSAEVIEESDGTYSIEIYPDDYWNNYDKENFEKEVDTEEKIMLCLEGIPDSMVDTSTVLESYDGDKFTFDGYANAEIDEIDGKVKFMYDYLVQLHVDDTLPMEYEIEEVFMDSEKEFSEVEHILPDNVISQKVKESYEKILEEINQLKEYEVEVSCVGQKVEINIVLTEKDFSAEKTNEMFKILYEEGSMETGDSEDIMIFIRNETDKFTRYISYDVGTDCISEHKVITSLYYGMDLDEEFIDEYEIILNKDEFYKSINIPDYHKENGVISFR